MSRIAHKLGITSLLVRQAWYYLGLGLGKHESVTARYDYVVVSLLYDWKEMEGAGQGGFKVTFFAEDCPQRYVELTCKVAGGGGTPILREVT